jgi:hypothetical protein
MTMGPYYTGAGESIGLYSNGRSSTTTSTLYFEWFIYQVSATQPATPVGGVWDFVTNTGTPPTGWSATPPAYPSNTVWVSTSIINSLTPTVTNWSTPGQLGGVGAQGGGVFQVNNDIANVNYTIQSGQNAFSVGPITISSGVTITVTSGQKWLVV